MARVSAVEQQQVEDACAQLFLEGKNVSFDAVYELIGRRGSARVVQTMIAAWRKEIAQRFVAGRTSPDLPEDLVAASDRLLASVWGLALEKAEAAYVARYRELEAERARVDGLVRASAEQVAQLEREAAKASAELAGARALIATQEASLQKQARELVEKNTYLRSRDDLIVQLRHELAELRLAQEARQREHDQALIRERERHEQSLAEAHAGVTAAIQREREIAEGQRSHLMLQTDQIRQSAKLAESSLREQLTDARTMLEAFRRKAADAENQSAFHRGRAEAAESSLKDAQLRLDEATQRLAQIEVRLQLAGKAEAAEESAASQSTQPQEGASL